MSYQVPGCAILSYNLIFTALFAAACISLISYKLKLLTKSGATAAFFLGATIFSLGQLKWSVPLIIFFVFSSLLSKIGKRNKKSFETVFEKSSQRDFAQVLANGAAGGILAVLNFFYVNEALYLAYIGSLSAVCADTWATEIGTMKETFTYNILTLKKIKQGTSGGVSLNGTVGALLGTIIIALSALFWIHLNIIYYFCLIVFAGLFASFLDSFLGASIQLQNKCKVCGVTTEKKIHCGKEVYYFRGLKFVNNDTVNFLAAVAGSLVVYFINVITN